MQADNEQINPLQLVLLLMNAMIGVGVLVVPARAARPAGSAGWLAVILAGLFALVLVWLIARLCQEFPDKTIVEMAIDLLGNNMGVGAVILLLLLWLLSAAFILRTFGEINRDFLLPNTPIEITILGILLAGGYLARKGIEPLARLGQFSLPISILLGLGSFLLSFPGADSTNLLPLWGRGWQGVLRGAASTNFAFVGYEVLLVLLPFLNKPKRAKAAGLVAVGTVTILYTLLTIVCLAVFGACSTAKILWPTLIVARTIELPGLFLERIDVFIYTVWLVQVFLLQSIMVYVLSLLWARIMKIKEHKILVWPLVPVIYFLALFPLNIAQLASFNTIASVSLTIYVLILVLGLSLLARGKGGKARA